MAHRGIDLTRWHSLISCAAIVIWLLAAILVGTDIRAAPAGKDKDWPQYRGGPDHDNYRKIKNKIRVPKVLWRIGRASVPAAVGDDVYAGGNALHRVDLKTGAIEAAWRPETAGEKFRVPGTPVVLEDRVIAYASDAKVRALDRGLTEVLWSAAVDGIGDTHYSGCCDGKVYLLSSGSQVTALDPGSGAIRWTFTPGSNELIRMSPALAGGKALFGSTKGIFYAIDVKNGRQVWTYEGERAFAYSDPVVSSGKIFVGDRGGFINAIDLKKGTLLWSLESGATGLSTPGVLPGKILVGFHKVVATIDVKKGRFDQSKKGFRTGYNPFGSPTLVGSTLFFGNLDGHLYAFDYKSERLEWAFEVGAEQQVGDFIYHRDVLIVTTGEGIFALGNDRKKKKLPKHFILTSEAEELLASDKENIYTNDVRYALKRIERNCSRFFELKGIDWKKVSRTFLEEAGEVKNDSEHLVLLVRLLARLRDGHAAVRPLEKGKDVKWPEESKKPRAGPGLFLCRVGKKIYVKNSWATAASAGIEPGMEVLAMDGSPIDAWLEAKIEEISDTKSFSTDQQALFFACHWGLAAEQGSRLEMNVIDSGGKKKKTKISYANASVIPVGPVVFPDKLKGTRELRYGRTGSDYGYIHLRKCPGNLPELTDEALAALGKVPGLILDFRSNGGGGFDHGAFMGRFIPEGRTISFTGKYESAGPNPYGGPIVVIVDAGTRSAGETAAGIFKEDGRAYMIGESPTAGMSSQKTTIELPSGLFALYVSVASNKGRFNGRRGIEGIGVIPHEIVEYDPADLAQGVDTLVRKAEELLVKFPQDQVPYDPAQYGW